VKTYLVEEYSPKIEFDKDSVVVALTPKVCYQLDKERIKYSIIEDYYDEVELSNQVDEYFKSQLQWIERLDEFLQNNVKELKELNLKLGTIYYYYLKTMVLDPLYIRCYTLNRLFEAIKPSAITFISHPPRELPLDFRLQDDGKSYYSRIIPLYCRENDIRLTLILSEEGGSGKRAESPEVGRSFASRLRRMLVKSETVRSLYFVYKYLSRQPLFKQPSQENLSILIPRVSYHIWPDFAIDALKRGHNVYELQDDLIVKRSFFRAKRHFRLQKEMASLDDIWEHAANLLESSDLIRRINEQCQLDVSEIILPRLRYFVSKVCPEILRYFKILVGFYEREMIDFILAPYAMSLVELGALAAASFKGISTVCLVHGDDAFAGKWWPLLELQNFDIVIPSNREFKEYLECLAKGNNISTELYTSPHRLLNVRKIKQLREKKRNKIRKGTIIYLPTFMMWDARRVQGADYPVTWYYEFQKSLIEYFSTKREYTFVWKGLPQSDHIYNPIPNFIRDNNFSNIEVATNLFTEHLLTADRVICDYPSTGFYESVVAGVPTMSLYHKALIVRKSAVEYFGNLLKPFSNIPEAINHIDEFLNSNPELYKTTIEMEDKSILDILEEIGKKTNW
jgi:hypothetical protein